MKNVLKKLLKKYKWQMLLEVTFILLNILIITYPAKILGQLIDLLYDPIANKTQILQLVVGLLGVCVLMLGCRLVWKNLELKIENKFIKSIKDLMFKKLLKAKVEGIDKIGNGEIMSYFVSDIKIVSQAIIKNITNGSRVVLNFIIVAIIMYNDSDLKLTIITLIPVIITIIVMILLRNRVSVSFRKAQKSFTDLSKYIQESTDSIRTMKAFVGEQKQMESFQDKSKVLKQNNLEVTKNQNLLSICVSLGFGISYVLALIFGSKLVISSEITKGQLVAFIGYLAILEGPISFIPYLLSRYKKGVVSYKRLSKMFDLPQEEIKIYRNRKFEKLKGNISIKNLTYYYPDCIEPALENINLDIKKGNSLGMIGFIGSGKTTLMDLLVKLYDAPKDKIFFDGKDINDIKTEKIRENICYITQDNFIFSTSIKENINLFKDRYKDIEIEDSTKNAMIYDDVIEMEKGIYTVIGEKGVDLSGGQKQRLVISRAFLSSSSIIIFDDTFSALDNKTEQHVLKNIRELTKDKTCIIISNRISDVKKCDEIIVLEEGKIVERGDHNSLIKRQGEYYSFYRSQAN